MQVRDQLPDHPVPDEIRDRPGTAGIRVEGLVAQPMTLAGNALAALQRVGLEQPFTCEEGWSVPSLRWRGVTLADVLAAAQPLGQARFVSVSAGAYSVSAPLSDASRILLCDTLNDESLSVEHGGPWRLVMPNGQCFTSVKWVERLALTADCQPSTAEGIARDRLQRSG